MNHPSTLPTIVGLCVALGGPVLLVSPADKLLGDPDRLATKLREQAALWILLVLVLSVVLWWEKRPLSSIGLRPLRWQSFMWGLALAGVFVKLVVPAAVWALNAAGIAGFESGVAKIVVLPIWFRVLAVVSAGIVEETLFRGYAVERLSWLTGSYWWAGLIVVPVFALVHLPFWGSGLVLTSFVTGGVATAFYVWKQDLLANIVAHVVVDALGLIIMPLLARSP